MEEKCIKYKGGKGPKLKKFTSWFSEQRKCLLQHFSSQTTTDNSYPSDNFSLQKTNKCPQKKMHLVLFLFVSVSYLFIFSFVSFSLVNVITSNTYYCVNLSMLRVYLPLLSIHNHSISSETNDHFCSIDTCTAGKKREKTEKIMNQ